MNWDAIGAVANLGAGIGVIATLFYLASQIRQNTRATYADAYQRFTDSINSTNQVIASDPVLARIISELPIKNFDEFGPEERVRLLHILLCIFRAVESLYYHHVEGAATKRAWNSQAKMIAGFAKFRAVRTWWPSHAPMFDAEFRALVQESISDSSESPTQP